MLLFIAHFATASALIKTTFCSIKGAEGGVKSGAKNDTKCGVKIITDKVRGHARARYYEVSRRPLPLLIR
jgi:hypothetical protein